MRPSAAVRSLERGRGPAEEAARGRAGGWEGGWGAPLGADGSSRRPAAKPKPGPGLHNKGRYVKAKPKAGLDEGKVR